jgi:hypothetical protein
MGRARNDISKAAEAMKQIGRDFWGGRYVAPMAAAMRTDGYALKRWGRCKGPANLPDRLARLVDSLILKYVDLAVMAVEWKLRLTPQSDIVTAAMANRLRDIQRELAQATMVPAPPPEQAVYIVEEAPSPALNLTLEQLCEGLPDWQQAQLRELDARPF